MSYFDSEALQLIVALGIAVRAFQAYIGGCEYHYTGTWRPSNMPSPPYLPAKEHQSRFVSLDHGRHYTVKDKTDFAAFELSRKKDVLSCEDIIGSIRRRLVRT